MRRITNVVSVGGGVVGAAVMAIMAEKCQDIKMTVLDNVPSIIDAWNSDRIPVYEPGLQEVVNAHRGKNLFFTTDLEVLRTADIVFIDVKTPTKILGVGAGKATMLGTVEEVARVITPYLKDGVIIAEKSTVPVGVANSIRAIVKLNLPPGHRFQVISNPEFLSEGNAVNDIREPSRILIGCDESPEDQDAGETLARLYERWVPREKILMTNVWSSELSKLAANMLLAQRLSSINGIAAICERTGADIRQVALAVGMDSRIGNKFLQASVGGGGSSFQKDVYCLVYIADSLGLREIARYFEQIVAMNNWTRRRFAEGIVRRMFDNVANKRIAVFGFSFKAGTMDTRESPAIYVMNTLLDERAVLAVYDPMVPAQRIVDDIKGVHDEAQYGVIEKHLIVCKDPYEACKDAHAIVLLTDWPQFKELNYQKIYDEMVKPAFFFDGRNCVDRETLKRIGFCTSGIGVVPDSLSEAM